VLINRYRQLVSDLERAKFVMIPHKTEHNASGLRSPVYRFGGPISDRRIVDNDGTFVTIRYKNYTTEQIEFDKTLGTEFADRFSHHVLPPYIQRVRYTSMFQQCGRNPRLQNAQKLITAGGFNCTSI